ncbi:MAG: hypothetical protein HY554_05985 [Elusimicrobia bacterium]|nr:hypothetical protein [Elusimicrobiota bacterium]
MAPKDPFLYRDWLEDFRREVDDEVASLRRAPAPPPAPPPSNPALDAAASLREWWRNEVEDPIAEPQGSLLSLQVNRELELSRREVATLQAELQRTRGEEQPTLTGLHEQVRLLSEERARLEEQLSLLRQENAGLRELKGLKASVDEQLSALRARLLSIQGEYEARLKMAREDGETAWGRVAAVEAELKGEREARLKAEQEVESHRRRLLEAEALRAELAAVRSEVESRLETAAEFLEAKIRSVQDQSQGQGQQLRELVEALRRLRSGGM